MDEREAVERLKQGDLSGMEHLVRTHQVRAARAAYLITRDEGLAADIVQQSFLKGIECIAQFDISRPFGPWFLRIVTNAALKVAIRAARQVPFEEDWETAQCDHLAQAHAGQDTEPGPSAGNRAQPNGYLRETEAQVENSELHQMLWNAMGRLSARDRAALVQRYYLGLSEAEMARDMQLSSGTVKWRLHQARKRLRQQMERGL